MYASMVIETCADAMSRSMAGKNSSPLFRMSRRLSGSNLDPVAPAMLVRNSSESTAISWSSPNRGGVSTGAARYMNSAVMRVPTPHPVWSVEKAQTDASDHGHHDHS